MQEQGERKVHVIVGLGNPGKQYERTRHNIGFMVVQALASSKGLVWREDSRWPGIATKTTTADADLYLLMPTTYMNESGRAVQRYLSYYKVTPASLLVVTDDVALDFGATRLRPNGGTGGHNGLKSIQAILGTQEFARLRMGIGDREHGDLADYVLADFTKEEQEHLEGFIQKGIQVLEDVLRNGVPVVMNNANTRKKASPGQPEEQIKKQNDESAQENQHESRKQ